MSCVALALAQDQRLHAHRTQWQIRPNWRSEARIDATYATQQQHALTRNRVYTVAALTALAVIAFAANSVLTRMALTGGGIEAAQFVAVRLLSGSLLLATIALPRVSDVVPRRADLGGVTSLLTYVVAFTFAYVRSGAATGALILFPVVQLTLILAALRRGVTLSFRERAGALLALAGVVCLLGPRAAVPSLSAGLLMCLAGVGWAV